MDRELFKLEGLFRSVIRMMKSDIREIFGDSFSSGEFSVLHMIREYGAMKSSEMSKKMEVSASHITSITDSLVNKGYMTRQRSIQDRRVVELAITTKGNEMLSYFEEKKSQYFQQLFHTFKEEEINKFIELFEKLLDSSNE